MQNLKEEIRFVEQSGIFDKQWYLARYPDVKMLEMEPIKHFLKYGNILGRNPNPIFDTVSYLKSNPDVKENGMNSLLHYLKYGFAEGRSYSYKDNNTFRSIPVEISLSGALLRIETCDRLGISGWFCPPQDTQIGQWTIILKIDEQYISITPPSIMRDDVVRKLNRTAGGFSFSIPEKFLDRKTHELNLYCYRPPVNYFILKKAFCIASPWEIKEDEKELKKDVILFCTHNLKKQGSQTSLFELVAGLRSRSSLRPVIYSPYDGPMRNNFESIGIDVIIQSQPRHSNVSIKQWKDEFESFISGIVRLSPKAIVANTLESYHSAIAARRLGLPYLLIPRESEPPETYFEKLPDFIREKADRIVEEADATVFVANATRKLWESKNTKNHFHTIHNGISTAALERCVAGRTREEVRLEMNIGPDEIAILSVGTVTERKGQLDLIKAIPMLQDSVKVPFRLFVIGTNDSQYSKEIEFTVSELPQILKNRVHLLPQTESSCNTIITELYLSSDIFVMNSRHESYPRVVLEALYFGLPVVSTPCFGVCEQVVENECALFYQAGDIDSLADRLLSLMNYPNRLKEFTKKAYARYNRLCDYHQMVSAYDKLLRNILSRKRK